MNYSKILILMLLTGILCAEKFYSQEVVKLSNNQFQFTEGPAWDGNKLYFSDIPTNTVFSYSPGEGFTNLINNSFSTNGIVYREGVLYICESGSGRVISADTSGVFQEVFIYSFSSESLNAPNDLCLDEHDGIYFTDPAFGFTPRLPEAVYYIDSQKSATRILDHLDKPNGILYSEESKRIYVSDTHDKYIYSYKVSTPGIISDTLIYAELSISDHHENNYSGADGMCFDSESRLYVATELGVQIFNSFGEPEGIISIPETPTNCVIGGPDNDQLFVTAQQNIYRVQLDIETGFEKKRSFLSPNVVQWNPIERILSLQKETRGGILRIYSISGQLLGNYELKPGKPVILPFPSGLYFINFQNSSFNTSLRIFIPGI